ncbi:MAG: bifunctional aldolase/short-chain dehydrogenase [Candidatus Lambdaproteobacteria bacterium]|nr:bifunctional aldolase/short-chain dehydrogenase [Candidatus Lambdaproteobacteria bacterium]
MENRWNDDDARAAVERYAARRVPEALALRVYSSRLIGGDPGLVLHGGGNTSVKGEGRDALGQPVPVLYVKGSGWDLATIEPQGFPAVRLEPIRALRQVERLSDEAMVNALRVNLLEAGAPNPSVEALLHAFLPHRFVDHTHADAILALVDQPDPERRCVDAFGGRLAVLPFVFPGFPLAGIAMRAFEADPTVEGLVLIRHGLFTFGATARESYDRMIRTVDMAEAALARGRARVFLPARSLRAPSREALAEAMPALRGALAVAEAPGAWRRMVLHHRSSEAIRAFVDGERLGDYAQRGVITPDHIIRTKNLPLILPPLDSAPGAAFARACRDAVAAYVEAYHRYFAAGAARAAPATQALRELDALPRVMLVPGAGLFTAGASERDAEIAADLYEHTIAVIARAEGIGRYTPLDPPALFEMEYWSLEQAKLGKGREREFQRQVALITGAASGIGRATALAFAARGAHLVLLDVQEAPLAAVADEAARLATAALPIRCDVTDPAQVAEAFRAAVLRFGGVDIAVSNAGGVWQGAMADCADRDLQASFALNFYAHHYVAREAVRVFRRQGTGGQLLFNASKSAFNPGPELGPYTVPKAAVVALMKQYALDYGALAIRSNAVNADRVPTALFGAGVLEARAAARGLSVERYLGGNLLQAAVRAEDVAQAFIALALSERTTGTVLPVDGGNIAAAPR